MGAEKVGDNEPTISVKITVNELRKALGINSNDVAANRLKEAVEQGLLTEDDSKRGAVAADRATIGSRKPAVNCARCRRAACSRRQAP